MKYLAQFLLHHIVLLLRINIHVALLAGYGVLLIFGMSMLPWITNQSPIFFFNEWLVTISNATGQTLGMCACIFSSTMMFGKPFLKFFIGFLLVVAIWTYGFYCTLLGIGVKWWYYRLQMFGGYIFSLVVGVGLIISLIACFKTPLKRPVFGLLFAMSWGCVPAVWAVFSYVVLPFFQLVKADWFRLLFRLFFFPLLMEIPLFLVRISIRHHPNVRPKWMYLNVFLLQFYVSLVGRFLLANFDAAWLSNVASVLLSLLEILMRLSVAHRDRFLYRIVRPKRKADEIFQSDRARRMRADLIISEIIAENTTIILAPVSMLLMHKNRKLFQFIYTPFEMPDTAGLLSSVAIQLLIEFATDIFCFLLEIRPRRRTLLDADAATFSPKSPSSSNTVFPKPHTSTHTSTRQSDRMTPKPGAHIARMSEKEGLKNAERDAECESQIDSGKKGEGDTWADPTPHALPNSHKPPPASGPSNVVVPFHSPSSTHPHPPALSPIDEDQREMVPMYATIDQSPSEPPTQRSPEEALALTLPLASDDPPLRTTPCRRSSTAAASYSPLPLAPSSSSPTPSKRHSALQILRIPKYIGRVDLLSAWNDRSHIRSFLAHVIIATGMVLYFLTIFQYWPSSYNCKDMENLCNCTFRLKAEFCINGTQVK